MWAVVMKDSPLRQTVGELVSKQMGPGIDLTLPELPTVAEVRQKEKGMVRRRISMWQEPPSAELVQAYREEWGAVVGMIKRGDTIFVDHIEVRTDHERQGWASFMIDEIFESHPEIEDIDFW